MRAQPLVSVITIFLDEERFLGEAVESVFAQSYPDWELLLVDDGSRDGSTALARRLAAEHPDRVRCLEHPGHENRGMSASRNLGLREARGEFVAFLDADDVFPPGKLAEQVAVLEAHPEAAMAYGRALIWHGWTGRAEDRARDHRLELGVAPGTLVSPPTLFHRLLANKVQTPMSGNAMLRRDLLLRLGGFEESFRGMYEDQLVFFKIHLAHPAFVSDACWLLYRQHPDSCSARAVGDDYHAGRRPLMEWLAAYVAGRGVAPDSAIGRAVARELWAARHPRLGRLADTLRAIPARALPGRTPPERAIPSGAPDPAAAHAQQD